MHQYKISAMPFKRDSTEKCFGGILVTVIPTSQVDLFPSLPNFSKIAAKIIEPKTGASTWALELEKYWPFQICANHTNLEVPIQA